MAAVRVVGVRKVAVAGAVLGRRRLAAMMLRTRRRGTRTRGLWYVQSAWRATEWVHKNGQYVISTNQSVSAARVGEGGGAHGGGGSADDLGYVAQAQQEPVDQVVDAVDDHVAQQPGDDACRAQGISQGLGCTGHALPAAQRVPDSERRTSTAIP